MYTATARMITISLPMKMTKTEPKSRAAWLDTNAAATELGLSARQLRRLRKQGLFKLGKHYRITSAPKAGRPTYQWHCQHCSELLETPLEKRS
jgi:hypothetical protein